jgi:fibronectin-binding autotransporter adhesin
MYRFFRSLVPAVRLSAVLFLVMACWVSRGHAQTVITWSNGVSGTITVGANWVGGVAPVSPGTQTWTGTSALITGGTAIIASQNVYSGTMTIDATGVVASSTNATMSLRPLALSNAGSIRHANSGTLTIIQTSTALTNSGVIEVTGPGALKFNTSNTVISNTSGLIRATAGLLDTSLQTFTINGGTLAIEAGAAQLTSTANATYTLNNVQVANAGTMSVVKSSFPGGNRTFTYSLAGTGTFNNSGIVNLTFNEGAGAGTQTNDTTSMVFGSSRTVINTGTINISQLNTQLTGTGVWPLFMSGSSAFTNQGRINISTVTNATETASLRWSTALGNAGVMVVDGPKSSIQLGSQAFTQSGAASALSLTNGGRIVAGSVTISSGTLLGTGTVSAPATIGGIVAPGSGGIGTLNMGGNVTWNAGNAWQFELGTAAASLAAASAGSSTQDLMAITGNFTKGTGSGFTFDFLQSESTGWYKIADWTGSTTFLAGDFSGTNLQPGNTANFTVDATTSALYVEIVPEPGALALAAAGAATAFLVAWRRSRQRQTA